MKSTAILATIAPLAAAFAPIGRPNTAATAPRHTTSLQVAKIEFIRGVTEKCVPDVKLTRARDGSSGTATFNFASPNVFDASIQGDITGMFLIDDEGEMTTNDVNARFVNGKPQSIESMIVMQSPAEWDRFMRFMERYAEANDLGFSKAG